MIAPAVSVLLHPFRRQRASFPIPRMAAGCLERQRARRVVRTGALAVLRIATHPGIFKPLSPRKRVEKFVDTCLAGPAAVAVRAGADHWAIFRDLCTKADCRGNLIDPLLCGCCAGTEETAARWDRQPAVRSMECIGDFSRLESTTGGWPANRRSVNRREVHLLLAAILASYGGQPSPGT